MKYTLIAMAAVVLLFTACEKKKTKTYCYVCTHYDSTYSNVDAIGYTIKYGDRDSICNQTDATIAYIVKTSTYVDTISIKEDTLRMNYHTRQCIQD